MAKLNWTRTGPDEYTAADAPTSSEFALVRERAKWRLLVDGEEHGPLGSFADRKEVARDILAGRLARAGRN